jgi:hypothetical protein
MEEVMDKAVFGALDPDNEEGDGPLATWKRATSKLDLRTKLLGATAVTTAEDAVGPLLIQCRATTLFFLVAVGLYLDGDEWRRSPERGAIYGMGKRDFGAEKEVERATTRSRVLGLETACHVQCGSRLVTTSGSMSRERHLARRQAPSLTSFN